MFHVSQAMEDLDDFLDDSFDLKTVENESVGTTVDESMNFDKARETLQSSLDESEDDELILSVVESIDSSFLSNSSGCSSAENVLSAQLSEKDTKKLIHESFSTYPTNKNNVPSVPAKSNINNTKHKLLVTDSPAVKSPKIEYERKFPGPAGLIVKNLKKKLSLGNEKWETTSNERPETLSTICSSFENNAWQKLRSDLEAQSFELLKIVDENIIDNVKRMNIIKHTSRKIPLFAAVIFHLDPSVSDPSVVLKDPSGNIHGTVHKDFWEQYSHLLIIGSALLLKRVSVLSILNSRKLCLNITSSNVVTIYTPRTDGDAVLVTNLTSISVSDYLRESKTTRIVSKENLSSSNQFSSKTTSTSTRSNDDLLKILKNSNSSLPGAPNSSSGIKVINSNVENNSDNSPCVAKSIVQYVLPKSQLSSSPLVASADGSRTSTNNYDLNCSIISSELEGIDTDCLFDDF